MKCVRVSVFKICLHFQLLVYNFSKQTTNIGSNIRLFCATNIWNHKISNESPCMIFEGNEFLAWTIQMRAKDSEEWWWIEFWLMIVNFAKLSPFIVPDLQSSLGLEINKVTSIIPRMLLVIESYVQIRRNVRELIYKKMKSTLIWLYKFNSNSIKVFEITKYINFFIAQSNGHFNHKCTLHNQWIDNKSFSCICGQMTF